MRILSCLYCFYSLLKQRFYIKDTLQSQINIFIEIAMLPNMYVVMLTVYFSLKTAYRFSKVF